MKNAETASPLLNQPTSFIGVILDLWPPHDPINPSSLHIAKMHSEHVQTLMSVAAVWVVDHFCLLQWPCRGEKAGVGGGFWSSWTWAAHGFSSQFVRQPAMRMQSRWPPKAPVDFGKRQVQKESEKMFAQVEVKRRTQRFLVRQWPRTKRPMGLTPSLFLANESATRKHASMIEQHKNLI